MMATTAKQPPGIAVQAFWLTASKFIAVLLNIGLPILLVRLLTRTEYGVYKEAFLFVGTAANVATFGVGMSAFYFMPRHPERGGQIALNILVYNFVAGWIPLIVLAFYPQLLKSLFRTSALAPLAILLGILVLLTLTSSLVQQVPTALQDVRYSTIFIVGTQFTRALLVAGAAILFRSIESLIVATILSQLLAAALLFWYLHDRFPRFWTHFDWQFFKEQLAYALPYGAFGLLWVIQKDLDNYFVSASLGPGDYAIYAVGWLDVPLISLVLESVVSVMIVRVSTLQQENRKAYKGLRNFLLVVRITIFVGLFCVLFPVIRHFGMMGAAIAAVAAQALERIVIAWRAAKAVDATIKDVGLYRDLFKVTGVTIAAGLIAYMVRNLINPAHLIPRIAAVTLCIAAIYLTATFAFRLPGWEMLSKERIAALVRTTLARMTHA
jgi:O-antigen/teichoic acid export membrane protein